jgi:hypothetical protein
MLAGLKNFLLVGIPSVFKFLKNNAKTVIIFSSIAILLYLCISLYIKSNKIEALNDELLLFKSKMEVLQLETTTANILNDLAELKKTDSTVRKNIKKIEDSLKETLPTNMTPEEVVEGFKDAGQITRK